MYYCCNSYIKIYKIVYVATTKIPKFKFTNPVLFEFYYRKICLCKAVNLNYTLIFVILIANENMPRIAEWP